MPNRHVTRAPKSIVPFYPPLEATLPHVGRNPPGTTAGEVESAGAIHFASQASPSACGRRRGPVTPGLTSSRASTGVSVVSKMHCQLEPVGEQRLHHEAHLVLLVGLPVALASIRKG